MITQAKRLNRRLSWSSLKHYDRCPAHWRWAQENPQPPTPAMILGSALHCMVLEPDEYPKRYVVAPEVDRRTKAGREFWAEFEAENAGREILTPDQQKQVNGMAAAIRDSRAGRLVSLCGERELVLDWTDEETGQDCTGRIDAVADGFALDIKTTDNAEVHHFSRAIANNLYHGQAAFYLDALAAWERPVTHFLFVAVEKNPPYCARMFLASEAMIEAGRALYRRLLRLHAECMERGEWPGYDGAITNIDLPKWAA